MIALLLDKPKKKMKILKTKASSSKSRDKMKKGENSTFEHSNGNEDNFRFKNPKSSYEEQENSENESNHAKRMNELEKRLEAIANRSNLQQVGVVRPYPIEWDAPPYPSRFKEPTLHTFDGKGSSNQHIYYFKS